MLTTHLIIGLVGLAFAQPAVRSSPEQKPPKKVLFIGNSLTAANDLPSMVQAISRLPGRIPMECTAITQGGASLEDHWNAGRVRVEITRQKWDFVVLQQGPSSLEDSRKNLRAFVKVYDPEIRRSGARTALYMVWPEKARFSMFQRVSDSYRIAAEDVKGVLLPAGDAWLAAWKLQPNLPLYGPDNFHPSETGSLLAALVIYRGLSGDVKAACPQTLKLPNGRMVSISDADSRILTKVVQSAVVKN